MSQRSVPLTIEKIFSNKNIAKIINEPKLNAYNLQDTVRLALQHVPEGWNDVMIISRVYNYLYHWMHNVLMLVDEKSESFLHDVKFDVDSIEPYIATKETIKASALLKFWPLTVNAYSKDVKEIWELPMRIGYPSYYIGDMFVYFLTKLKAHKYTIHDVMYVVDRKGIGYTMDQAIPLFMTYRNGYVHTSIQSIVMNNNNSFIFNGGDGEYRADEFDFVNNTITAMHDPNVHVVIPVHSDFDDETDN